MTKKEDKLEWDEGFGEVFEEIKERKTRHIFPPIEAVAGWKKEKE
jgi:hypothetical protein